MTSTLRVIQQIRWFKTVVALRCLWAIVATVAINALVPLGTSPLLVAATGIIGVVGASFLAHSRLRTLGFVALLGLLWLGDICIFWVISQVSGILALTSFSSDVLGLHTGTCLLALSIGAAATWIFWRVKLALTGELLFGFLVAIILFSGHREFHLDRPKLLNSLAWRLGVDHLTMLVVIGSALLIAGLSYLYCASLATRPQADKQRVQTSSIGRQLVGTTLLLAILVSGVYLVQQLVYQHFNEIMLARVANGVGMGASSGVSPLSFQSALGSTNQPAGIVRLEGDYSNNPFTPMMYLRESALSSFNGKEMVFAGRAFDSDLPLATTKESFSRQEDAELGQRTPLIQSIFLLADHDHAFAVDYPVSIVQLKNPRPNRFKSAYRAYSVAPAYNLANLHESKVGDPRWTPDIREHYVTTHPDKRYADLAQEVTKEATTAIEKTLAITNYLSRTAIYTLTPNHETKPEDDQVAPFLFGDHRGYCVHFAHAIVYMARSLGIPARVATGYLTDLSQAKDGHILLRMSDRHAWAEIFVSDIGWVPFDVQPDQVESHAETQVDAKLLEELMGILEPGEEILPSDIAKNEPGMVEPDYVWTPSGATMLTFLLSMGLILGLTKLTLREGWRLMPNSSLRLRWGYISAASFLYDIGVRRNYGETRSEFAHRTPNYLLQELSELLLAMTYKKTPSITRSEVDAAIRRMRSQCARLPKLARAISVCNPASLLRLFGGGAW